MFGGEAQQICRDTHLAVAGITCPDADHRDGQRLLHPARQLGRNMFQHQGEAALLLEGARLIHQAFLADGIRGLAPVPQAMHGLLKAGASDEQPAKVINIASIDGLRLNPWETYSYQASKAAVINLTKRLAARLVKDGILVTGIAPGAFASEMNKAARDLGDIVGQHVPAGRIGNDEDMAGVAIYLASRAGNYVVGETIAVDGGVVHAFLTESWEVDPSGAH